MEEKCVKFTVSGLVQGVGFRYHTSYQGTKLGLLGYARNLDNGDVEVLAQGTVQQLGEMELWLSNGPKTSRVDSLVKEEMDLQAFKDFAIRY